MLMPTAQQVAELAALSLNPPDSERDSYYMLKWLKSRTDILDKRIALIQKYHAKFYGKRVECLRHGEVHFGEVLYVYVRTGDPSLKPHEEYMLMDAMVRWDNGTATPARCYTLTIKNESSTR